MKCNPFQWVSFGLVVVISCCVGWQVEVCGSESKVEKELKKLAKEARADRIKREKESQKRREKQRKERAKIQKKAEEKERKKREKYEKEMEGVRKEARKIAKKNGASEVEIERSVEAAVENHELQQYELAFRAAQAVESLREMQRKDAAKKKVMWVEWNGKKIPATVFQPGQ